MDVHDEIELIRAESADRHIGAPLPPVTRIWRLDGRGPWTGTPVPRRAPQADGGTRGSGLSALAWGEGAAGVLLLHGAALNAHTWDATLLEWGVPALALDLPGHGESDWSREGDYSPAALADRIDPALDAAVSQGLLAPGFALVGHSLGGLTALELVGRRADVGRVVLVVLVDILPPFPPRAGDGPSAVDDFLSGPTSFASREEVVRRALAFGLGGQPGAVARAVCLNTRHRPDGAVVWKHHLALLGSRALGLPSAAHLWDGLADLAVPLSLIAARNGLASPEGVARLRSLLPGARIDWVPTGHNVQEEDATLLAGLLADLTGTGTGPAGRPHP